MELSISILTRHLKDFIKISFEAILYKNIGIFYKDFLLKGAVELLEEPQNKITIFFVKRL